MNSTNPVYSWLERKISDAPLASDDLITYCLPLFREVAKVHESNRVVDLCGFKGININDDILTVNHSEISDVVRNSIQLEKIDVQYSDRIVVTEEVSIDLTQNDRITQNSLIRRDNTSIESPVYIPYFSSWEVEIDHHDELTDIFHLGMILASLACGLNLGTEEELERFVDSRANLFTFNESLHPVIQKVILHMTELSRHKRAQDLESIISVLTHYRQHVGEIPDLPTLVGVSANEIGDRRKAILENLRQRLFEFSKRNRLLYFKENYNSLNLTIHSVPYFLNTKTASLDNFFIWNDRIENSVTNGKKLFLEEFLRFEDYPFIQLILDKIMSEDRRNRKELGFSQLRLVLANLKWHNLKENKSERITSPLLLLPVKVTKKRGVRNHITLEPHSTVAEVNPILRQYLNELYGLKLPEEIDLNSNSIKKFHSYIEKIIHASEPGITLNYVDKPQVKLIHRKLLVKLEKDRKRRKRLIGKKIRKFNRIDYCYSADNFHPLGLEMYLNSVQPEAWPIEHMTDTKLPPTLSLMKDSQESGDVQKQSFYAFENENENNPYSWDFDLCNMVLGNFNYSKMSLVRDYNQLLEDEDIIHPIFDDLFTDEPAGPETTPLELDIEQSFEIVPNDSTQAETINKARSGRSLIIQGPPGTGKSQTITNLIADYVARGKRVLFVCEKRAAIDVVYNRLKQHGLDQLSCMVHDTKADKKSFVHELRDTYNEYHNNDDSLEEVTESRLKNIATISRLKKKLSHYNEAMCFKSEKHGVSLFNILPGMLHLKQVNPEVDILDYEKLPPYSSFEKSKALFTQLEELLDELSLNTRIGENHFSAISTELLTSEQPLNTISELTNSTTQSLTELQEILLENYIYNAKSLTLSELETAYSFIDLLQEIVDYDLLYLLNKNGRSIDNLYDMASKEDELFVQLQDLQELNSNWKIKISKQDFSTIYSIMKNCEPKWYKFLIPSYHKVKKLLRENYDFSKHSYPPTFVSILDSLKKEYDTSDSIEKTKKEFNRKYKPGSAKELIEKLESIHSMSHSLNDVQKKILEHIQQNILTSASLKEILKSRETFNEVVETLANQFPQLQKHPIETIINGLSELRDSLRELPDMLPLITKCIRENPEIYSLLVSRKWSLQELEKAISLSVIDETHRFHPVLKDLDRSYILNIADELDEKQTQFYSENSQFMIQQVHSRFRKNLALASNIDPKESKKGNEWIHQYARGCSEWQHEFNKIMRYKSIRDLASDESGLVLADMKPIWLMSPLSVSDTIPLSPDCFDVVIFDEASQIPLEEAIPALFRAQQAIVVGDEKQLPPTNFFGAKSSPDDNDLLFEEDGEYQTYELNADSFLSQASTCFPSSMLGWHYRSRSESLISFSNASFYNNNLMTIPDCRTTMKKPPIIDYDNGYDETIHREILERPISFHYLDHGLYENRRNAPEAIYIAQAVKSMLMNGSKESIGIIAFSEAQQSEIESAINALQLEDPLFDEKLDEAYEREDDGEFRGLFVKNLENVQGDERDIIIISVCYGYNSDSKMIMNFGPINKMGGEKRLNVIFSRAKKHIALVSSIHHTDITNDYNIGANCLKRYLQYAEAVSIGDHHRSQMVLNECCPDEKKAVKQEVHPIAESISDILTSRGWEIDFNVGNSEFICDIAIRKQGESNYRLGLLLDTKTFYENPNISEQYIQKKKILEIFGWRVSFLFMRDWINDTESVLSEIEFQLNSTNPTIK